MVFADHAAFPVVAALLPLPLLQPVLSRIVCRIADNHREMFDRLGPHRNATFVIDPVDIPFVLLLRPDPDRPVFRASPRAAIPPHDAMIAGRFLTLLQLVDAGADGDALFFSRALTVTGNTEAVVCLRNALDDVEGSIAADVADLFGPPGRFALARLRAAAARADARIGG
jgi:O2-independent ubiquinone biosynthesis accessory factor UbiT